MKQKQWCNNATLYHCKVYMYNIFRLITSFRFYVAIVAVWILVMLLTRIDVDSFRWVPSLNVVTNLKQWDNIYISQQKIADQAVLLAYVNITLWHQWQSTLGGIGGNDIQGSTIEKAILTTKYLNSLRTTNILDIQKKNPEGSDLTTLTQQWNILVQQGNILIPVLNSHIEEQQGKIELCTAQKKQADDRYNQALKNYNSGVVEKSTEQAQEASVCISTASVAMNSAKGVLAQLQGEMTKTQKYIGLITTNKSLLIKYAQELWTTIPTELVQLQKELQNL